MARDVLRINTEVDVEINLRDHEEDVCDWVTSNCDVDDLYDMDDAIDGFGAQTLFDRIVDRNDGGDVEVDWDALRSVINTPPPIALLRDIAEGDDEYRDALIAMAIDLVAIERKSLRNELERLRERIREQALSIDALRKTATTKPTDGNANAVTTPANPVTSTDPGYA